MHHPPFILASGSDGLAKLIIFVLIAVIYGIAALASMIKKAVEQANKRSAAARAQMRPMQMKQPARPMPAMRPAPAKRAVPVKQTAQRAAALKQMTARPAAAPPPLPPKPVAAAQQPAAPAVAARKIASANVSRTGSRQGGATALSIRRWLRPDTMRKQFILTELLQPPIALRDPANRA